jgi:hypothetical protein
MSDEMIKEKFLRVPIVVKAVPEQYCPSEKMYDCCFGGSIHGKL